MSMLRFTQIELHNWKNFVRANVPLARRVLVVGPNASGKSNFLDAFRFLRDLSLPSGGGLAPAVAVVRAGVGKLRSLHARGVNSDVMIRVEVRGEDHSGWRYELAFTESKGVPIVRREIVERLEADGRVENVLKRPDPHDDTDRKRLIQTAIEQVNANEKFRELNEFFSGVSYLHLVPQLLREGQAASPNRIGADQYGRDLLDRMGETARKTRDARLRRIRDVLKAVTADLQELTLERDERGRPHLSAKVRQWRPTGAYQDETQLSDGTLRLIGLLWALQEKAGPLLLEEPELSLHYAIVRKLAPFIAKAQRTGHGRQVILSTHSENLLLDPGISADEILLVRPAKEGSEILPAPELHNVVNLMQAGMPAAEAVLPLTEMEQMDLFEHSGV